MAKKWFTVLENNPEVMNALAAQLGVSPDLQFYDVYSLTEPALLSHIPRPALALLVIIPMTEAWKSERQAEDTSRSANAGPGSGTDNDEQPVLWFRQTIGNACGSIGLLHCALNGPAAAHVTQGSTLARIRDDAQPLGVEARAQMLYDSEAFERAHAAVAGMGQTVPPATAEEGHRLGHHFVAFVKTGDGRLWELEGSRPGPIVRGVLGEDEDVLSPKALELGLERVMKLAGDDELRFSCLALARKGS